MKKIFLLSCLLFVGCNQSTNQESMPTGAKNVKDLGHGWSSFELDIDGKTNKFLYRRKGVGGNAETECITQIK